jgi:glycosyltransferase involved in cell wall biosynthesis
MKIAFVTPWYGPDIPGGMEAETRRTAEQMVRAGLPVEVLTTTIRDFFGDWGRNHHRAGVETIAGVTVRRFPVLDRDKAAFDAVNWRLMQNLPISSAQERTYIEEMFRSPALYAYLADHCAEHLFFFIPYMFATTYFGAQICPDRSFVIPCLHDESYARLSLYREVFPHVRGLIFHTGAEKALADALYPAARTQERPVLGEGVDTDWQGDAARFRHRHGVSGDFILVVGRKDAGKNTPLLLNYWRRYQADRQRPLTLVFIGPGALPAGAGAHPGVRDLGFVSQQEKYDAYAAAAFLCQPSLNESFSLVLMESWLAERPALVHGACAVTQEQVVAANAGLFFTNFPEFAGTVDWLLDHPEAAARLGRQGRRYVLDHFHWDVVIDRYRRLIDAFARNQ